MCPVGDLQSIMYLQNGGSYAGMEEVQHYMRQLCSGRNTRKQKRNVWCRVPRRFAENSENCRGVSSRMSCMRRDKTIGEDGSRGNGLWAPVRRYRVGAKEGSARLGYVSRRGRGQSAHKIGPSSVRAVWNSVLTQATRPEILRYSMRRALALLRKGRGWTTNRARQAARRVDQAIIIGSCALCGVGHDRITAASKLGSKRRNATAIFHKDHIDSRASRSDVEKICATYAGFAIMPNSTWLHNTTRRLLRQGVRFGTPYRKRKVQLTRCGSERSHSIKERIWAGMDGGH